ncbi:MAG: hypothetical protein ABI411_11745 [Tahibacter sp.]
MVDERAGPGGDSIGVAESVVAIFRQIDVALAPVIGQRGVAALYKRSLHLAGVTHRQLTIQQDGAPVELALHTLHAALLQRSRADAIAFGVDLIVSFQQLLTTLVGGSLTERLLRSVWTHSPSGTSAQGFTP